MNQYLIKDLANIVDQYASEYFIITDRDVDRRLIDAPANSIVDYDGSFYDMKHAGSHFLFIGTEANAIEVCKKLSNKVVKAGYGDTFESEYCYIKFDKCSSNIEAIVKKKKEEIRLKKLEKDMISAKWAWERSGNKEVKRKLSI
jgi:hypothetical protein